MKTSLASMVLLLTAPAFAEDYNAIVGQALANISHNYQQDWAFTESTMEDGVTFIGRYDPGLPEDERWTLISVDDREPTDAEIAEYRDDKDDEFNGDGKDGEFDIVDRNTLDLVEETNEYLLFSFTPVEEDSEDEEAQEFMRHVDGTIKIIRDGHYPAFIDVRNRKPVRPAFGVKISKFLTRLEFGPAGEGGPIVPLSIDIRIKARAMLVISIDETDSTTFSDYSYAGS